MQPPGDAGDDKARPARLSIIIPTRNRPQLAAEAAASALVSLPEDAEVLVIDDGSDPGMLEALARNLPQDSRLRLLSNDNPGGASLARNFGVDRAGGDWVFFLDDDDRLAPGYVAAVLAKRPEAARWGFSPIATHAPGQIPTPPPVTEVGLSPLLPPAGKSHFGGLGAGFWIARTLWRDSGGLDPGLKVNEDTEFGIRLMAQGHWGWIADRPGVSVLRGNPGVAGQAASLTARIGAAERAGFFSTILRRHADFLAGQPPLRRWLEARQLAMIARSDLSPERRREMLAGRGIGTRLRLALLRIIAVSRRG